MFKANQGLTLDHGHIDISYRDPDAWPNLSPGGSIKAFKFDFGDPVAGPSIQLGLMRLMEGETLDWKHGRDPVHHHGSDQFRVISGGEWDVAGRSMSAGGYVFQESGWVYQEHPGDDGMGWVMLVMGDRRGTGATLRFNADQKTFADAHEGMSDAYAEDYTPVVDDDYPHPAGNKGLAAIATTAGQCEWGYLFGRIADIPAESRQPAGVSAVTGVLGDPAVGPVVHVIKSEPNQTAIPACSYPTELLLVIVAGSCRIGAKEYVAGELRVQPANEPLAAVTSGEDGLEAVLVVADRRARPALDQAADAAPPPWMHDLDALLPNLMPRPGGFRRG